MDPMPVPVMFTIGDATLTQPDGTQMRAGALSISTPVGDHVTFWDPDALDRLAAEAKAAAERARKPIIQLAGPTRVVGGRTIPPTRRTNGQ